MAKRKTVVPFHGTAEQEKALRELIAAHKEQQGALMPVLQGAQEIYGYLPIEVQTIIAEELNIPLAEVYGVVTFYAQFTANSYTLTWDLGNGTTEETKQTYGEALVLPTEPTRKNAEFLGLSLIHI